MASERQIAANRRNAAKSTGPRSAGAKKRTSRNALRHGLAASFAENPDEVAMIDQLAQQIAGSRQERIALACARDAAVAQFDLARVRRAKAELIRQVAEFGSVDPPEIFSSPKAEWRYIKASLRNNNTWLPLPIPPDPAETMPADAQDRVAEAIRRALPELAKLERYESRAIGRRNRALRALRTMELTQRDEVE
ncbi:hypothetical protein [Bradyrhizobium sp. NC92]|uniref:hypothetical protein n=1 Tax=Bradyrhizobium sp. (strain NC92) TaxID=55395 RepID=UPI0021A9EDE3|nr:hypothetical protein [Bradyrhizobium sp. NC92]UWU66928.1 hypothetical protein N2602_27265 [Bradyrhizobium sp. NC92]